MIDVLQVLRNFLMDREERLKKKKLIENAFCWLYSEYLFPRNKFCAFILANWTRKWNRFLKIEIDSPKFVVLMLFTPKERKRRILLIESWNLFQMQETCYETFISLQTFLSSRIIGAVSFSLNSRLITLV